MPRPRVGRRPASINVRMAPAVRGARGVRDLHGRQLGSVEAGQQLDARVEVTEMLGDL